MKSEGKAVGGQTSTSRGCGVKEGFLEEEAPDRGTNGSGWAGVAHCDNHWGCIPAPGLEAALNLSESSHVLNKYRETPMRKCL